MSDDKSKKEHSTQAASQDGKPPRKPRGPVFWLVTILLGGGAVWWLVGFVHHSIVYRATDDAYTQGHVHKVSARLPGDVSEVFVDDNDLVKAGQPLARIDAREYETALQRAKANLAQAEAQEEQAAAAIEQAVADEAQSKASTLQAQTQISEAEAQLGISSLDYDRDSRLYGKDARAVSKSEVDSSQATYKANKAAFDGAKANLAAVQAKEQFAAANVKAARAQLSSSKAAVGVQRAAVADAERELSYTTLYAPSDGRIGNKNIEVGNRVQTGQALFAVVEAKVWVVANFKETQLGEMREGQPVEMTIDTFPGRAFTGHVDGISPATGALFALLPADNATGNFTKVVQRVPVKIVFDPESLKDIADRIHPGLSTIVNVRIK
jgi:membrane fusion protein (multidrug efflux system)